MKHAPAELDGLELTGFVPAGIRGVTWEEPVHAAPAASTVRHDGVILDAPHAGARVRAKVTREAEIRIRSQQSGFWEVTVRTPRAEVDGYIPMPSRPAPRPGGSRVYEFSDETIEGELVLPDGPLPPGTCLHEAPGGEVAGMLLGPHPVEPRPVSSAPGWVAFGVSTVWGDVTYYAPAPPE